MRFVERTGSTNADLLANAAAPDGEWLVALEQQDGRGRQGREWTSPPGNFYGSTLIAFGPNDPPAQALSLAAGIALIRAVEAAAPATGLMLKWPNDLLLGAGKLGGILLERSGDRIVAGFGVNLAAAPDFADRPTAALSSVSLVSPESFAPLLAASMDRAMNLWRSDLESLRSMWLESAHPLGTRLTVHGGDGELVAGRFEGLEPDGALRLRTDDGQLRTLHAGDVSLG
ncbi:biotin--[acetyl-CoA-carboxylase] ligase [Sphingomonas ginkgonis]|uniref:biotin--[biotin carboxyl-carrier protein] ligase n=1 Tax=Sphingomonas ginkgonis TaxID=2315330 RepID=A0A3R9XA01_9SPHN|nr:biotin--[acetyl-CoA-carboxylase] ligase [Sphingomonas ginkgonis]RST32203.1 biotin--[acetyl-CoA-carboxylase] ligase [Sphingomonas ginkgonis]